MTEQEAITYIENYGWSTTRLGLDRTRELLDKLGNPQRQLRFIHVAGSNGKGSVCAMFASILRAAGYKTGLYTSPYIEEFNERIQINGESIPGLRLAEVTERVMEIAETMPDHPSQFELVTATAILYFQEENCDIVVLETGMGGALDSTNAIDAPELAVITNIGLEHTEYLGKTLKEIAEQKAGIIKTGSYCVCYDGDDTVTKAIRDVCTMKSVPFTFSAFSRLTPIDVSLDGQRFLWDGVEYRLSLLGGHQLHNVALVLTGIETLQERGWSIPGSAISKGLETVKWPARLEILSRSPLFILDGGHNPQCAEALAKSLDQLLPGQKVIFLTGVLADKDYASIMSIMMPYAKEFVCISPDSPRRLPAGELASYLESEGAAATACQTIEEGIIKSLELSEGCGGVVAFGSLYLAGTVRNSFAKQLKRFQRKHCMNARRAMRSEERKQASHQICEKLKHLHEIQNAKIIFSYLSAWDEVDLSLIHRWFSDRGIKVAYPVSHPEGIMNAMIPEDEECWEIGKYDIRVPVEERSELVEPEAIDVVLIPCVGFDEEGGRLGHGAGYYDRYIPKCKNAKLILVAYDSQRVSRVGREKTDQDIDIIITERSATRPLHIQGEKPRIKSGTTRSE